MQHLGLNTAVKVLIADLVGLRFDTRGQPDASETRDHIVKLGGHFHKGGISPRKTYTPGLHFFYLPDISTADEILALTAQGQYDAVIAAATIIPRDARFALGGVRIGAGTGNMQSSSWGGGSGAGGHAVLMNTPSFNSRATAQMVFKALLSFLPDIDTGELHRRSVAGRFDTGKNLRECPTEKLEGKTCAVLGFGNIGREVALLAQAFHMHVRIYARSRHKQWIESEGFVFAATPEEAASGADVLSVHTGLGNLDAKTKRFANQDLVNAKLLKHLNKGAVLLNYDRGECVDAKALSRAMAAGRVQYAAIDADIFKQGKTLSGPLVPYLPLAKSFGSRILLLPHAAADTEHVSRVGGAKQAVNQIFDLVLHKCARNVKGEIPDGLTNAGSKTVAGVGKVSASSINDFLSDAQSRQALAASARQIMDFAAGTSPDSEAFLLAANRLRSLLRIKGLEGPGEPET